MRVKKILSVCGISLCLCLSSIIGAQAVSVSAAEGDAKVIRVMGILNDDKGMSSEGKKRIRREEFAGMLIRFTKEKNGVKAASKKKLFRDVKKGRYRGYVNLAGMKGYMRGYSSGKFEPKKPVNLAMAAYSSLKLLGYTDAELLPLEEGELIQRFQTLQLNKNIHKQAKDILSGSDCMELFVNLIYAPKKDGVLLGKSLGYSFHPDGSLDSYSIIMDKNEMSIAKDNGQAAVRGKRIEKVYRNDKPSDVSMIERYDLMYYNPSSGKLYVYSDREYGQLSEWNINPVTSVAIIGGRSLELAGKPIDIKENDDLLGLHPWREYLNRQDIKIGDYVVAIRDINGKVVALEEQRLSDEKLYGIVLGNETKKTGNNKGGFEIVNNVILATSTGRRMELPSPSRMYGAGNIVSVRNDMDGRPVIVHEKDMGGSLDGKAHLLSDRLRAIEVGWDGFKVIPAERIKNADLSKLKAEYIGYNDKGEIVDLILRDSFGEAYLYGILKDFEGNGIVYLNKGKEVYSSYDSGYQFDLSEPAFAFGFKEGKLNSIQNLTVKKINRIKGNMAFTSDNQSFYIADDADVYYKSLGEWKYDGRKDMEDLKGHTVKGYAYGKSDLIRIIIIEK